MPPPSPSASAMARPRSSSSTASSRKSARKAVAQVERKPIVVRDRRSRGGLSGGDATPQLSRIRGLHRQRRSGVPLAAAGRRVAGHQPQLHLRHDRQSQGRRLSPSRRLPERHRRCHHLRPRQPCGLSLDAADVPLQRLVLHLGRDGGRRHPCLPAQGRPGGDLSDDQAPWRHPPVRRADRAERAGQCARCGQGKVRSPRRRRHRRRRAAERHHRGHGAQRLPRPPHVRPDRDLRPEHRLRLAERMGGAADAGADAPDGAPGRALPHLRRPQGGRSRNHGGGSARRRRPSAS